MKLSRLFYSMLAMLLILLAAKKLYDHDEAMMALRDTTATVEAEILHLSCGRTDYITLWLNGQKRVETIYLTYEECDFLSTQKKISLKVDADNDIIVFANEAYNNARPEFEQSSSIVLAIVFIYLIFHYYMLPEFKKLYAPAPAPVPPRKRKAR